MKKSASFTFYLLYYAAGSFIFPFLILYLQGLGFNGIQIGLLSGMTPLVIMIGASFWTGLADARGLHKLIMSLTLLGAIIFSTIFPFLKQFSTVLLITFLYALCIAPAISFADSATMAMLAGEKTMYGRVRLGGTIGWGVVAPLAGLIIQNYGLHWGFWSFAAIMIFAWIISQKFTYSQGVGNLSLLGDVRQLLTNRRWVFFLVLAFIGGVAFTAINSFLFAYLEDLGISRSTMSIALTISTIGELPVLFFANRLLNRFGAYGLFALGMVITGVRLVLYAVANFPSGILFFQLLNGMTFPMVWVAGVSYADEHAPQGMKATAQGLLGAMISGIGAAIGGLAGGLMLESMGGQWMYLIIGCIVLVCIAVIVLIDRLGQSRHARGFL